MCVVVAVKSGTETTSLLFISQDSGPTTNPQVYTPPVEVSAGMPWRLRWIATSTDYGAPCMRLFHLHVRAGLEDLFGL
jgi:hypothetical protein